MTITLTVDELRRLIADERDLDKSPGLEGPAKGNTTFQIPPFPEVKPKKKILLNETVADRKLGEFFKQLENAE